MAPSIPGLVIGLALLTLVFGAVERLWPSMSKPPFWRRADGRTDLVYWFFTPVVTGAVGRAAVIAAVVLLAAMAGVPLEKQRIQDFASLQDRVSLQPLALQVIEVLVISDLIGYATHRAFHGQLLWRFHAVHHSSQQLDWLSAVRIHPLNDVLSKVAHVVGLIGAARILGFQPALVAGAVPFFVFWAIAVHANVTWTFGPLRYFVASPAFHRWHHTTQEEGLDKNFAGLFPWIDLLFGTFYMPKNRQPVRFGIIDGDVPAGFMAQMAYPFRRLKNHGGD